MINVPIILNTKKYLQSVNQKELKYPINYEKHPPPKTSLLKTINNYVLLTNSANKTIIK